MLQLSKTAIKALSYIYQCKCFILSYHYQQAFAIFDFKRIPFVFFSFSFQIPVNLNSKFLLHFAHQTAISEIHMPIL